MKKRIIVGGDTSTANSGFAVYKKHLLKGLMDSNLFEVAEVGNGGQIEDKQKVPWKYYPTAVKPNDERYAQFTSNPANEYGAWRWERICLDYKPTHTVDVPDPWQVAHILTSPLRPYYHTIMMPTVDSVPQRIDFLQIFKGIDSLYTYTDWAKDYLNNLGYNCLDSIGMGVNTNVFKPVEDKKAHRRKYNLPEDAIIFGFVARNQMRKRFPDIIESFALFLKKAPKQIAEKSFLYLHTSFPDQGFDLPVHLLEQDVINKVLFTYYCQITKKIFCSTFKEARAYSPHSKQISAIFPNVANSPTDEQLAEAYNLMDCYLQPANCEGWGAPIPEAASCNLSLILNDYSAMEDHIKTFDAVGVKPGTLNIEHGVMARRASMDIEAWADALLDFAIKRPAVNTHDIVRQRFSWDIITNKWIRAIEIADMPKVSWNAPIKQYEVPKPEGQMSVTQFLDMVTNGIPQLAWSVLNLVSMRSLNNQMELNGKQMHMITPQVIAQKYEKIINHINMCEQIRTGHKQLVEEDFLK